jgi:hypothetical protein
MWIREPKRWNGRPFILVDNNGQPSRELPLPDMPILKNVMDFDKIIIRFVFLFQV